MLLKIGRFLASMQFRIGDASFLRCLQRILFRLLHGCLGSLVVVLAVSWLLTRVHLAKSLSLLIVRGAVSCLGPIPAFLSLTLIVLVLIHTPHILHKTTRKRIKSTLVRTLTPYSYFRMKSAI